MESEKGSIGSYKDLILADLIADPESYISFQLKNNKNSMGDPICNQEESPEGYRKPKLSSLGL